MCVTINWPTLLGVIAGFAATIGTIGAIFWGTEKACEAINEQVDRDLAEYLGRPWWVHDEENEE